jgi:hypothetical protein
MLLKHIIGPVGRTSQRSRSMVSRTSSTERGAIPKLRKSAGSGCSYGVHFYQFHLVARNLTFTHRFGAARAAVERRPN